MMFFPKNVIFSKNPPGGSWNPLNLPNLLAWWDSDNPSTITLDGSSRVSNVTTVNSSAYTLTNTISTARRPLLEVVGGRNTFKCVGSSTTAEFLKASSFSINQTTPLTIAMVVSTNLNAETSLFQIGSGSSNGRILVGHSGATVLISTKPTTAGFSNFSPNRSINATTFHVVIVTYSGSGNNTGLILYCDGQTASTNAVNAALTYTDSFNHLGAAGSASPTLAGTKNIGDYIVCNTVLGSTDIDKLTGFLAHKWSATSVLPALHPYKSTPPTI